MKNMLLLFFTFSSLFLSAQLKMTCDKPPQLIGGQGKPSDKNFTLLLNGRQFHSGDTILKNDFYNFDKTTIQFTDKTIKKNQPTSYQWVIFVKDSNTIYRGTLTNPPSKERGDATNLIKIVRTAATGDIFFLDEFQFAKADANLPKQFSFFLK